MNPTPATTDDGIPPMFRRTKEGDAAAKAANAEKLKAVVAAKKEAAQAKNADKPAKVAKPAKEPKAPKQAKAKPAPKHQPADITRTDENPARSIVPMKFKAMYAEHGGNNGDKLAAAVTAAIETRNADGRKVLDMKALEAIATTNGIDFTRYATLNNGQKSMNVRNRLRGLLKAGKKVIIGKQTFANAEKALAKPEAAAA